MTVILSWPSRFRTPPFSDTRPWGILMLILNKGPFRIHAISVHPTDCTVLALGVQPPPCLDSGASIMNFTTVLPAFLCLLCAFFGSVKSACCPSLDLIYSDLAPTQRHAPAERHIALGCACELATPSCKKPLDFLPGYTRCCSYHKGSLERYR